MKEEILEKLVKIEKQKNITILLAVETGSRAWGYSNQNSDYDVSFIYKHNDISKYLVLDKFQDVFQSNDGLFDFTGWDVKKALYMHFKSNPNLREWIISPTVYIHDEVGIFRNLPDFNRGILKNHYFGLAHKTNKKYIRGNDLRDVKTVKKTLYVIRCILAWQVLDKGIFPPISLFELLEKSDISDNLKEDILTLRHAYSTLTVDEVDGELFERIHKWIAESSENFPKTKVKGDKRNINDYNERFQEIIGLI